jgi:transcriptional regulator with XRE-family HTH domain
LPQRASFGICHTYEQPHECFFLKSVGRLLQHWRQVRRKSQFVLALDAGISTRHLSFVESGRSNPSRDMVLRLAQTLEIPFRERNDLLVAAGYAHLFRETGLSAPELAHARQAIELILQHQEPFPAVVMDRHWNLVHTNQAATRLFGLLLEGSTPPTPPNVVRLMFHPQGLRPWVSNWEDVALALIQRVHREAVGGVPDEVTNRLLAEVSEYAGVPKRWNRLPPSTVMLPLIPVQFRKGDLALDFFSTVTTLGTPCDITLQEIRIECFFPANDATAHTARELMSSAAVASGNS